MTSPGHGVVGMREQPFTRLLPAPAHAPAPADLFKLAIAMKADVDEVKDGPDPEENLWFPAGYTYFGQFIDHDLTFDSTSSLNPADTGDDGSRQPTNLRTPRFDLDCLYGDGPAAQPFMYADDGASLVMGGGVFPGQAAADLARAANGRAIIGDKRNDENSIVAQIQLAFIKYHNAVVDALKGLDPATAWNTPGDLFASARNEVRWTYQKLILQDFLPRLIHHDVLADFHGKSKAHRATAYVLYTEDLRDNLPREFVAAAYRFGHSGVRFGYRLNRQTRLAIFPPSTDHSPAPDSLLGFDPLPSAHVIDNWGRFFPMSGPGADIQATGRAAADSTPRPEPRLQYAYKIDPTLVDPLAVLPPGVAGGATAEAEAEIAPATLPDVDGRPSLALLNLLRGASYRIAGGQAVADRLISRLGARVTKLDPAKLAVRTRASADDQPVTYRWSTLTEITGNAHLTDDTPLWFYVLAEAQAPLVDALPGVFSEDQLLNGPGAQTRLGWVGGRIVAEVFYGLLDSDPESVVNHPAAHGFKPRLANDGAVHVRNLLEFG